METTFASAIYTGTVRHRRFSPKKHEFKYRVFMMYLDTLEIETLFSLSKFWSLSRFAPVQLKRADFHIDRDHIEQEELPGIAESVRNTIQTATGSRPAGPIRMLVNLRYWGICMNPLSTYYCFDDAGENLVAILAEVHNTPWNQRHAYVLTGENFTHKQRVNFVKKLHVSPFNPVAMDYHWHSTTPNKTLALHLENWQNNTKIMDASLTLVREPINASSMNRILIRFPWMTAKVIVGIYWQALKLWLKGTPIYNHTDLKSTQQHPQAVKIKKSVLHQQEREL
jgi:hypothetical protein